MAEWKKLVTSGSNISQLNNDAGYLTSATIPSKNAFASSSVNGVVLIADSPSGSLNFASSSGQGLTISGSVSNDTITFGLAAIPNSSLLNSGSIIGTTPVNLGTTVTSIAGLTLTSAVVSGSLFGTASYASQALTASYANAANSASYATSASQAITASFALNAPTATTASFVTASNVFGPYGSNSIISASQAVTATSASQATTASFALTATSSSYANNATTASYANTATSSSYANNATSASYALTASFALNGGVLNVSGSTGTGSVNLSTQALSILGTTNEISTVASGQTVTIGLPTNVTIAGDLAVNGGDITTTALTASLFNSTATQVNIGGSALQMRIGNAAGTITIPGNLTVQGTTTTISSSVLEIADQFIVLASGSNTNVDGGIIIQNDANGSGHAFGYGTPENRWVMQSSLNSLSSSFAAIDGYVNTTQYGLLSAIPANPSYGGATYGYGNMYTATDTSEIYIWA
jgi:hypothetical protein